MEVSVYTVTNPVLSEHSMLLVCSNFKLPQEAYIRV